MKSFPPLISGLSTRKLRIPEELLKKFISNLHFFCVHLLFLLVCVCFLRRIFQGVASPSSPPWLLLLSGLDVNKLWLDLTRYNRLGYHFVFSELIPCTKICFFCGCRCKFSNGLSSIAIFSIGNRCRDSL